MILDLFAGPGGWSEALASLGRHDEVGIELDADACATAEAAGHKRMLGDIAHLDPADWIGAEGLIASPPCQAWSSAGKGLGLFDQPRIFAHLSSVAKHGRWLSYPRDGWHDERSPLVLEVVRWADAIRPTWIACEQVPQVLPFWRAVARWLAGLGYRTWAGRLSSERYGVPQTRERAILMAHRERLVAPPAPTHQAWDGCGRDVTGQGDLFGDGLLPWVSMAEALGWDEADRMVRTGNNSRVRQGAEGADWRDSHSPYERSVDVPAPTLTAKSGGQWVLRGGTRDGATMRTEDEPAAAVFSSRPGNLTWRLRNNTQANSATRDVDQPAGTLFFGAQANDVSWVRERPATTVAGDPRIAQPGHRDREGGQRQFDDEAVKVSVREAAILQGFRPDYPWQGTKTSRYQQVGNAVPPPMAAAVLRQLIGESQ